MTVPGFILKNALRNKRRATLSVLSVAASLFLLVTLQVALHEFTVPPEDIGSALRVIVRSKISIANSLPARQRQIIERIPGVEIVSPFSWFGGKFLLTTSASAEITFPNVVNDLLMFAPSLSLVPLAPVLSARSLPAKSTKLILDTFSATKSVMWSCRVWVKKIVKTA